MEERMHLIIFGRGAVLGGGANAVAESGQETKNGEGFFSGERWRKRSGRERPRNQKWRWCLLLRRAVAQARPRNQERFLAYVSAKKDSVTGWGRTEEGRNRMHLIILESDNWWWLLRRAVAQWRWQSESAVGRLARERLNSRLPHPVQRRRPPFWADTSSRPTRRPA